MKHLRRCLAGMMIAWGLVLAGLAQPVLLLDSLEAQQSITAKVEVAVAADSSLGWEAIRSGALAFAPVAALPEELPPEVALWVRLELRSGLDQESRWVIEDSARSSFVDAYLVDSLADPQPDHLRTGIYLPAPARSLARNDWLVIPVDLPPGESRILYLRLREIDHSAPACGLILWERNHWQSLHEEESHLVVGLFSGILLIMFAYHFILFFSSRSLAYLYYALYLLSLLVFLFSANSGVRPQVHQVLFTYLTYLSLGVVNIFYFLFGKNFVHLKTLLPGWHRWLLRYLGLRVAVVGAQLISLLGWFHVRLAFNLGFSFFLIDALVTLLLCIALLRTSSILARYFVAGSSLVVIFAFGYTTLSLFLELGQSWIFFFVVVTVEIVVFAVGLGHRMQLSDRKKLAAQRALNQELTDLNALFGRFVPQAFFRALGYQDVNEATLGDGVEREVTVFFSDIRDYTTLSEEMSPEQNFHFLNSYLGRMGPVVRNNQGFVNQFFGDGIMALFLESPQDAVRAAIDTMQALHPYNEDRRSKNRRLIEIGIGIHTGPLMMGVIGDSYRLEAGVVSDAVNTTSRLEGLTKVYGASVLVSTSTVAGLADPSLFRYRFLGLVSVKGRKAPIAIYDFYDGDLPVQIEQKEATSQVFERGLQAYFRQDFAQAAHAFDEVLVHFPTDKAAQLYQQRCRRFLLEGVPPSWNGVEIILHK